MRKVLMALLVCGLVLMAGLAQGDTIVKPYNFSAGTPASADEVNADFDTVYDQVNKVGAAVTVGPANRIGIGTATPAGELHVSRPQSMSTVTFTGSGPDDIVLDQNGYNGTGTTSYAVRVSNAGPTPNKIEFSSDGGSSWSLETDMVDSGLAIGNGVTIGFATLGGHTYGDQWDWTVSQGFPDGLIVSDGKVVVKEIAIENGATAGNVLTSDASGNATWQAVPPDADSDPANELNSSLTLVGTNLVLADTGGQLTADLSSLADDADADPTNELNNGLTLNAVKHLELTDNGGTLSADLSGLVDDADADPANELNQELALVGMVLNLKDNGGTLSADLKDLVDDADANPANELNTSVTMNGTSLEVTDAGGTKSANLAESLAVDNLLDAKYVGSSLFLGDQAGAADDGTSNVNLAVGPFALTANTSGANNVALGSKALFSSNGGSANTAIGRESLSSHSSGSGNIGLGIYSGYLHQTGDNNLFIGNFTGYSNLTGSNNLLLGTDAGLNESGSNKLYIDNTATGTATPLIYGDFATKDLTVNGSLTVASNAVNAGYFETDNYAVLGTATGVSGRSVGTTDTEDDVGRLGVYGYAEGGAYNYGLYGRAGGTVGTTYGVYGTASGGGSNTGVRGYVTDSGSNSNYGLYGYASGAVNFNYGVVGSGTTADFYATGTGTNYGASSSIRWKRNIVEIEDALGMVMNMRGVYFDWDEEHGGSHDMGFIAEEVGQYVPEIVTFELDSEYATGLDYGAITPILLQAIKGLKAENDAKDAQIAALTELVCLDHPEAQICQR